MDTPKQDHPPVEAPESQPRSAIWKWLGRLFRLCFAIAVIGASSAISWYWMSNPPVTQRRPRGPEAVLVETVPVSLTRTQVMVHAMGFVAPALQIQLAARVNGQIIETDPAFVPGGRFAAGDQILRIDPSDYQLAVAQQEANLTRAESEVRLEMGQQSVVRREFELLMDDVVGADVELLLRQPQLAAKEAAVAVVQTALDKAKLDLERTRITAPFNAIVLARTVELGAYVAPGASLATLVGTDEFWVEASVPVNELKWIAFPDAENAKGSPARIFNQSAWGAEVFREGRVVKLLPDLEERGRMARVIVAVPQPLDGDDDGKKLALLLDSFVRVTIEGAFHDNIVEIPRGAVHGGDQVWIMLPDNTLDVRTLEIIWGTNESIYVDVGLYDGEALVVSDLAAPVPGMSLRTADMPREGMGGQGAGPGAGEGAGQGRQRQ